jgi:hypothetical protein
MSPDHERSSCSTSADPIMAGMLWTNTFQSDLRNIPSILDRNTKIVLCSKLYSSLDVCNSPNIYANWRNIALSTRNTKSCVKITRLDTPIGEGIRSPVDKLRSTGLVRSPGRIGPLVYNFGAVSRRGRNWVTSRRRRNWINERLRYLWSKSTEIGCRWPTFLTKGATAGLLTTWQWFHRRQDTQKCTKQNSFHKGW